MSDPDTALETWLRRWEELTTRETDAIDAEAWDTLAEAQRRKAELQAACGQVTLPVVPRWHGATSRLIDMERRNSEALGRRLDDLRHQIARLDQAGRDLRRVHRSYAPGGSQAGAFSGMA
jgi:hypothetical protein